MLSSVMMWQARAGSEMMATSRQALNEILSHVELIKVDLQTQQQIEEQTAHDTVAIMCTVGDIAEKVDKSIAAFGARMSKACLDVSAERVGRHQLEQLLWTERLCMKKLGLALVETDQTAREAVAEGFELSARIEKLSDEKSALERQVRERARGPLFISTIRTE
jgi:hypothetical protein